MAVGGLWLGKYDAQRRRKHAEQVRKIERLDEFASLVSHDLRNPLAIAQGRLELAKSECESDQLAEVEEAHTRMERLIDEVLRLAWAGDAATERATVELADLVTDCWEMVDTPTPGCVLRRISRPMPITLVSSTSSRICIKTQANTAARM